MRRWRASCPGATAASLPAISASCSVSARASLPRHIAIVFGQRSQLWWQLPVRASFELLGQIYGVDRTVFRERLARLTEGFAIGGFIDRPVAQLSLGQRLRCEIAGALIPAPSILLLDEPTIGLDV